MVTGDCKSAIDLCGCSVPGLVGVSESVVAFPTKSLAVPNLCSPLASDELLLCAAPDILASAFPKPIISP